MRAYRSALITGLIVGAITGVITLTPAGLDIEEGLGLQWLFHMRGPIEAPSGIVIVSTADPLPLMPSSSDEPEFARNCLDRLRSSGGRHPRCVYTKLVERLDRWGASVIVFDIFFGEQGDPVEDRAFAQAIARAGRVVLLQRLSQESVGSGNVVTQSVQSPVLAFAETAAGLGPFPMPKVPARVSQFWTFKTGAGDVATLPAVALQVEALPQLERFVRVVAAGRSRDIGAAPQIPIEIGTAQELTQLMRQLRDMVRSDGIRPDRLSDKVAESQGLNLPAAERNRMMALARLYAGSDSHFLNFYGPPGTIRTIPVHTVLGEGAADSGDLQSAIRNSVVFVGQAARSVSTQFDGHYTVFSRPDGLDLSGVEIAASAYANLRNNEMLDRPNNFSILLIVIAGCILVGVGSYQRTTVKFTVSTLGVATLYAAAAAVLFVQRDLWMPVILPVVGQFVTIGVCLALRAGFVHGPPRLIYGVCLLTDIGRFTETIERFKLRSEPLRHRVLLRIGIKKLPLVSALRSYFKLLGTVVERWGGSVLHQIGDSMICIWRIRQPKHDRAEEEGEKQPSQAVRSRACQAALEIVQRVTAFNDAAAANATSGERLVFPTRIGMDVGHFQTGYFGRTFRMELLMVGDPANTAARLEQLNKVLGTQILVSQPVIRGLEKHFVTRCVGTFVLSGKREEVVVYELRGFNPAEGASESFCRRFEHVLHRYADVARTSRHLTAAGRRQAWASIADELSAFQRDYPDDGPTAFFMTHARDYSVSPPEDTPWPVRMVSKELA